MSSRNIIFSEWLSQIRKIWGQSGDVSLYDRLGRLPNELFSRYIDAALSYSNNIYLITQKVRKIDINFKELSHALCMCHKVELPGIEKRILIVNDWYFGNDVHDAVEMWEAGAKPKRSMFSANEYSSIMTATNTRASPPTRCAPSE